MLRHTALAIVGGLLTASCSGSAAVPTTAAPPSTLPTPPATSVPSEPPAAIEAPGGTTPPPTAITERPALPEGAILAPDFELALGQGGVFTLSEEPNPVLILFWAEWCSVCRRELPTVDAVASEYEGRVTFVAVAGRSSLAASAERVGVWFSPDRFLWGYSDEVWGAFGVAQQPVGVLITADGYEVDRWFGAVSEDRLRQALDFLISYG
jgi:thiol-disulfide isomerase/thioredoxin